MDSLRGGLFVFHCSGRATYFPCSIVFQALCFLPMGLIAISDARQVGVSGLLVLLSVVPSSRAMIHTSLDRDGSLICVL